MIYLIIALSIFLIYFILTFLNMLYSTKYHFTFNCKIFQHELNKSQKSIMYYFEAALLTLMLIGLITTIISNIQIIIYKRKKHG